jgi:uncharacterized protein with HEPN domain
MTYEDFTADRKTVDAVIRNFIIIGVAAARVPDVVCSKYSAIPWHEMRGLRNFVVHEYFGVSDRILWDTVRIDLFPLQGMLEKIIDDEAGG